MPIYKYKFCDGTVNEVEVSDEQYALLKEMDKQEAGGNRKHRRRNIPLRLLAKKEYGHNGDSR